MNVLTIKNMCDFYKTFHVVLHLNTGQLPNVIEKYEMHFYYNDITQSNEQLYVFKYTFVNNLYIPLLVIDRKAYINSLTNNIEFLNAKIDHIGSNYSIIKYDMFEEAVWQNGDKYPPR